MYAKSKTKTKPKSCLIWRAQAGADYGGGGGFTLPGELKDGEDKLPPSAQSLGTDRDRPALL